MAVPKRHSSKSKKGNRRSHDALIPPNLGNCPRCSQAVLPHRICANCGWYRNRRQVLPGVGE